MSHLIKAGEENKSRIEEILNQEVTTDTPVLDFLFIAGWDYWGSSLYEKADDETRREFKEHVIKRKERLTASEKILEGRLYKCAKLGTFMKAFRTIGELKDIVEREGIPYREPFKGIGYKTIAHLNEALSEYGLEPLRIGGHIHKALLKKHGLTSAGR